MGEPKIISFSFCGDSHCSTLSFCRLKPIDIAFMKILHTKVNIVPVIAKADCLTKFEMQRLKRKVSDLLTNKNEWPETEPRATVETTSRRDLIAG